MAVALPKASPRAHAAYTQLYRAFTALDRAHEHWLMGVGSNGARYAVLAKLLNSTRPMTPSDVAESTGRSPNAISPLIRTLLREGLIKQSPNSADGRSYFLTLTVAGRKLTKRLEREEIAFVQAAMGGRPARELNTLDETLQALEKRADTIQRPH